MKIKDYSFSELKLPILNNLSSTLGSLKIVHLFIVCKFASDILANKTQLAHYQFAAKFLGNCCHAHRVANYKDSAQTSQHSLKLKGLNRFIKPMTEIVDSIMVGIAIRELSDEKCNDPEYQQIKEVINIVALSLKTFNYLIDKIK